MKKKERLFREKCLAAERSGAEQRVCSVSDNVSQWLRPSKCQQPANFTLMTLIRLGRMGNAG